MIPFVIAEPTSLGEAIELLDVEDPTVRPLGGGTALMLMMKAGLFQPSLLVSLRGVEDSYRGIAARDDTLEIGALTPLRALEFSAEVRAGAPVVTRTMRTLSNVRVRNVATVGGCLAHADPHMDLPPVMTALGASVTVTGRNGERAIALDDLYEGYYETALAPDELISTLHVPATGARAAYVKCTTRSADDWPAVGVAVALHGEGDSVSAARVVVSAATEKPVRLSGAEGLLSGTTVTDDLLKLVGDAAADEAELISDPQGTAAYKRQLLRVSVARAVRRALDGEG